MSEGGLDHFGCVQVALRKDERSGSCRIRGGVRVRCDKPNQIVRVVGSGKERSPVALHVVHIREIGDVAGILSERVLQQVDGDRVEFYGIDLTNAIRQRGHDLVSTCCTNNQHSFRVAPERSPGDLASIGLEAIRGGGCAVVLPDRRPPQPVMVEHLQTTDIDSVNTEYCAPVTASRHGIGA